MRILLTGNSPFCQTGYGIQPAQLALQLKALGHDVAIFAYYGHAGSLIEWNGIPVYPNPADDYGVKWSEEVYKHFNADCIITLVDVWVIGEIPAALKWFPWVPIDHEPMPPNVYKVLVNHVGLKKPIAMSRFGEKEMKRLGIDCFYVPHMIDCTAYHPDLELRKSQRDSVGWTDKFVIGKVGTNVRERKDWTSAFLALSKFVKYHDDVVMYCHTNAFETRGRHLQVLRENLMIQDFTFFPPQTELLLTGVSDITMNNMYNSLDVYLSNSKGEGFGIPTIEAQAAGVPVIVSNNSAQPELCGGGWILKDMTPEFDEQSSWEGKANPDEIVEYLEQAYQEKKSGKLAERKILAREKAIEYDIANVMKEYWIPTIQEIEKIIKQPSNLEGVQNWRLYLIPKKCEPKKVLDIGCGLKQPYRKYLENLGDYVGIDIRPSENVVLMDAHNLNFRDKEFGFVWMSDVLEHVDNPNKVLREAKRVGEHGICVFSTPNNKYFEVDTSHKEIKMKYLTLASGDGLISW